MHADGGIVAPRSLNPLRTSLECAETCYRELNCGHLDLVAPVAVSRAPAEPVDCQKDRRWAAAGFWVIPELQARAIATQPEICGTVNDLAPHRVVT